jgi:hypothetical protein
MINMICYTIGGSRFILYPFTGVKVMSDQEGTGYVLVTAR